MLQTPKVAWTSFSIGLENPSPTNNFTFLTLRLWQCMVRTTYKWEILTLEPYQSVSENVLHSCAVVTCCDLTCMKTLTEGLHTCKITTKK